MSKKRSLITFLWGVRKGSWKRKTALRETVRQMDRHTGPSDEWTDGQTNRQISGRYVIDINMDYTLQSCNLLFFINIKKTLIYSLMNENLIDLNSFYYHAFTV